MWVTVAYEVRELLNRFTKEYQKKVAIDIFSNKLLPKTTIGSSRQVFQDPLIKALNLLTTEEEKDIHVEIRKSRIW